MGTPSIAPNDRLDKDLYLVLEDIRGDAACRETDERVTYLSTIDDLLTGHYDNVLAWSRSIRLRAGRATCQRTWRMRLSGTLQQRAVRSRRACGISSKARQVVRSASNWRCSNAPRDRPDHAGSFGDLRGGGGRKSNDSQ
jgi:hypothetical protein